MFENVWTEYTLGITGEHPRNMGGSRNITRMQCAYQRRSISHDFVGIERRLWRLSSSNLSPHIPLSHPNSLCASCCFHQFMQLPFKVCNYGWHFCSCCTFFLYSPLLFFLARNSNSWRKCRSFILLPAIVLASSFYVSFLSLLVLISIL